MSTQQRPSLEEREGMESAPGVEVPTSGGENSDPHIGLWQMLAQPRLSILSLKRESDRRTPPFSKHLVY